MKIASMLIQDGPALYYDAGFRRMLEDHLVLMRNDRNASVLDVDPEDAYRYEFDFFSYLKSININDQTRHFIIMRASKMTAPTDFNGDVKQILLPSDGLINQLFSSYKTGKRIPST